MPDEPAERGQADQEHQRQDNSAETLLLDLVQQKLARIGACERHDEKRGNEPERFGRQKSTAEINNHPAEIDAGIDRGRRSDIHIFLQVERAQSETADRTACADQSREESRGAAGRDGIQRVRGKFHLRPEQEKRAERDEEKSEDQLGVFELEPGAEIGAENDKERARNSEQEQEPAIAQRCGTRPVSPCC